MCAVGWRCGICPTLFQRAEDSTADADRAVMKPRGFEREATSTERALLSHLGFTVPEQLTTVVKFKSPSVRNRRWPQLEDES